MQQTWKLFLELSSQDSTFLASGFLRLGRLVRELGRFIGVDRWQLHNSVFRKSLLLATEFFQRQNWNSFFFPEGLLEFL